MWTFPRQMQETPRATAERALSTLKSLEYREAELVRQLVTLKERRAYMPAEISERQVAELAAKLEQLRGRIDDLRAELKAAPEID